MSWSSEQYSKFEHERNRPIRDLLFNIPITKVNYAADIGCGPGNSTELLRAKFPNARITGMDSSENMIEAARKRMPDVHFEVDDISSWRDPGPYDVILANAALQWVSDHQTLFPALISKLAKGGCLAVQMPDNFDEPAHRLMRETAAKGPWATKLNQTSKRMTREGAEWYYRSLRDKVATLDIWRTVYHHPLQSGPAAIVEWFKGTGLRPFIDPLDDAERKAFLAQYEEGTAKEYPQYADGSVLLPFPRLFIVATI
ncbi:trans-aconitate 2-methyltransferase [Mucilaginibacter sp. OK268]|uniref:trans-aconitate 2-methyltransferase n=1 Tax=Mucilaginibacter sp. OK268 TaxID=1881048 RepID=UPI00088C7026|nr:trans-aconitate 2-methyltransferase [Mucilaginibacter sp. OK268]SDP21239.1 trans-aconitate 2-methyltransferase [Mucilaginibacter sp. OK268]